MAKNATAALREALSKLTTRQLKALLKGVNTSREVCTGSYAHKTPDGPVGCLLAAAVIQMPKFQKAAKAYKKEFGYTEVVDSMHVEDYLGLGIEYDPENPDAPVQEDIFEPFDLWAGVGNRTRTIEYTTDEGYRGTVQRQRHVLTGTAQRKLGDLIQGVIDAR